MKFLLSVIPGKKMGDRTRKKEKKIIDFGGKITIFGFHFGGTRRYEARRIMSMLREYYTKFKNKQNNEDNIIHF